MRNEISSPLEFSCALGCFAERHSLFDASDLIGKEASQRELSVSPSESESIQDLSRGNYKNGCRFDFM